MNDTAAYIGRETRVSVAINAVFSLAFYIIFFGFSGPVRIGGVGGFEFDFIPQSFAITLMSVLVPGLLTIRKLAAGKLAPEPGKSLLPQSLFLRALLMAATAALAGAAGARVISTIWGTAAISWLTGAAIKIIYGILLARIVTPIGLMAVLRHSATIPASPAKATKGSYNVGRAVSPHRNRA